MIEQTVEIPCRGGTIPTFIVHPDRGGPHPLILFFMDAPGIREELRDMARRFASAGYYVMLPNLYYRSGVMELSDLPPLPRDQQLARMMGLMGSLTTALVEENADALMDFADRDPAASPGPAGAVGYCMSGQYAINVAARHPERIAAAASVYGGFLVTDRADSPHRAATETSAELYFACAEHDEAWAPLEMVTALREALRDRAAASEVEIYPGAHHGFAFPQREAFDKPSAERHWSRLFELFRRTLR